MGYKQGETDSYDKFTDAQKDEVHRKPWLSDGGRYWQKLAKELVLGGYEREQW